MRNCSKSTSVVPFDARMTPTAAVLPGTFGTMKLKNSNIQMLLAPQSAIFELNPEMGCPLARLIHTNATVHGPAMVEWNVMVVDQGLPTNARPCGKFMPTLLGARPAAQST